MEKQDLINACAVPIAKADQAPLAFTISEVIDCCMKEYDSQPPPEKKVVDVEEIVDAVQKLNGYDHYPDERRAEAFALGCETCIDTIASLYDSEK